jgi:hypothetical protein
VQVLNRLDYLTQDARYRDAGRRTIEAFAARARDEGTIRADHPRQQLRPVKVRR